MQILYHCYIEKKRLLKFGIQLLHCTVHVCSEDMIGKPQKQPMCTVMKCESLLL